jgi:hypothetical protein
MLLLLPLPPLLPHEHKLPALPLLANLPVILPTHLPLHELHSLLSKPHRMKISSTLFSSLTLAFFAAFAVVCTGTLSGCSTLGQSATDVLLTGAGGYIGYEASGKKIGGAALGAGGGYLASKLFQSEFSKQLTTAEKAGYDKAMNQAVKQQYWIIQNQQKRDDRATPPPHRTVTVRLPETVTPDGTILKSTTVNLRTE